MEDTEVEEGEACYFKDDSNIDPDIALSYIDEKLQNVLGHFQKDFEGGVSAENLGPKFGGYGSFLPTYQRSPSVRPQPKTPQRVQNLSSPKSPNVLPVEGGSNSSTAPSDAARSLRIGNASSGLPSLHGARALPAYVSSKQDSCLSSAQVNEKFPLKLEPVSNKPAKQDSCLSSGRVIEKFPTRHESVSNKSVNPTEHRTLKVRIKVGSDNKARKNAAIYSGLGLISPSSSMGNSPSLEEGSEMPSECQMAPEESPNSILRVMTCFPVPGGLLLSPLHESLLCLERKEKLSQNSALVPAVKCDVEHSAVFANDPASLVGNKKAPKDKKTKILAKSHDLELLKQDIRADFDDKESTIEKLEVVRNLESEIQGWKQGLSNKTKLKPLSNFVCHVVEVDKGGIEDKSATGLGKEFSESISDQEVGEYEMAEARSSSIEKICESRLKTSLLDISTDRRENVKSRCNKVSAPFNADADVSTSKRDSNVGATGKSMQKVGQTAAYYEEDETRMPHGVGKSSVGGKSTSRGRKSSGKPSSEAEGGLMGEVHEVPKDKKKAGKMHSKSKLQNDNQKTRHKYKDVLPETRIEQINNQINTLERPFVDREKDSNLQAVEKKHYALLDKQNEVSTFKRVDNLTSETILIEAANDARPSAEGVTSEMEHTLVDPLVIEENWVCCDRCEKWRLLPYGTKPDQLPEKWLCSMLNWLNGMNRCDISEEETTNALHALYQLPLPQSQNHLQNHVAGTAARAADACHFDQSHLNPSSHPMPNPRKKKQKSKGTPYAAIDGGRIQISGYTNNFQQEEMKRRHLNDTQQPTLESKLMSNSNVEHLSKSGNFPVNRIVHKQKEKHAISGDSKLKTKREADSYGYESTKKIKADVAFGTVKSWTAEHSGNIDKIAHGVESGLPSKPAVKRIGKHNEKGSSKDVKSVWDGKVRISSKKLRDCAPVSLQTGSFDMETFGERKIAPKKRKLKDWQEDQSYDETPRDNVSHVPDSNLFLKESSDIELGKGKKCRVTRTEGKESSTSKVDTRLNTKNKVTKIVLSGNKENPVQGREEVRKIEKDQQPRKYKIKVSSNKPASDEMDPLKRDLGSEQLSRTATSSSSKVSDSRKSRTQFPEVRGSPVESVSSSPMRTYSLALARKDTLGNDAVRSGDFPGMDSPRKSFDGEANVESKRSGTARRGKVSGVFHSESLGFPMLDFRENNASQEFGEKCKSGIGHLANSDAVKSENPFPGDLQASDNFRTEDRVNVNHYDETAIFDVKSTKGSSLLSKDMVRTSANDFQRVKLKVSDPPREMEPLNLKHSLKDEVETGVQNVALLHEGSNDFNRRIKPVNHERSGLRGSDGEDAKRSDPSQVELRGGNSQAFQPHAHKQGNAFDVIPVGASSNDDLPKVVPNQCLFKDVPSTLRKDVSSQLASNALKEAEDLRCVADRLKDSEFAFECNEAYFQAALKFLHGASLLENCSGDGIKIAETSPMQIYSRCAKYCGDCALEYEKRREMAAAALAYKCMEVAYMKIVYCKNSSTNRDRHDLQTSLQMVPQGESPSSCVSDVDNLNNQAMVDKTAISKGVVPHAGNHAIVAHNQLNFVRLLDFTKDVNSAMEASRKSQTAFAAANVLLEEAHNKEGIVSVKRVIDFSFQDIEELLRLVRHAIGAISCQGLGGCKD